MMLKFKELIEQVELEEANIPVEHAVKAVTKVLGSQSAARFATHLKPGTEKHTNWHLINKALMNQGVKSQHIAKIAVHLKPAHYEEVEIEEGISIKSTGDTHDVVNSKGEVVKQFHKTPKGLEYAKQYLKQNKGNSGLAEQSVEEGFGDDFLKMAQQRNPNARISTADQRKKEAEELAKKREGLKPVHAAPTGNARPLGGHDPKSGRSYSEEADHEVSEAYYRNADGSITAVDHRTRTDKPAAPKPEQSKLEKYRALLQKKVNKEEVEQVDELKKSTVGSYVKKASREVADNAWKAGTAEHPDLLQRGKLRAKAFFKAKSRMAGIDKATDRLAKEEVELDEAAIKVGDVVVWNKGKTAQTVGKVHKIEGDHYILHHAKTNTYHKVPKQGSQLVESELDEAKGALTYKPEHAKWGVVPKSSKEFVKFFPKDKEADAKAHAEKTGGTLKKIDQAGRAMKEEVEHIEEGVTVLSGRPTTHAEHHYSTSAGSHPASHVEKTLGLKSGSISKDKKTYIKHGDVHVRTTPAGKHVQVSLVKKIGKFGQDTSKHDQQREALRSKLLKTNEEVELDEVASVSVTIQTPAPADKKYVVTEIHPKKSARGRTRWKTVSYHSSAEEAKAAADAHAKKNNLHRMKVSEEVEQIDEISTELKQKYLGSATEKHLQQFLGRAPVRGKQELDKRRAAIQKTSKELTGKTHYQESVESVAEGSIKDAEQALARHGQYKVDYEKEYGPMSGADLHKHEVMRERLLAKKRRAQSAYAKKQGVAEGYGELDDLKKKFNSTVDRIHQRAKEEGRPLNDRDKKAIAILQGKDHKVAEEIELDESLKTHYQNGYDAQKKGKTRQDNPHREGTPAASMWAKGWEHSSDKREPQKFANEEVDQDEVMEGQLRNFSPHSDLAGRGRLSGYNKTAAGKKREADRETERLKDKMKFTKSQGGIAGPKGKLPEEVELDEAVKKKLAIGSKVSHPEHGKGTVVMHSLGGGTSGTVVKFANGKKMRVDHKKLRMEEVEVDQKMLSFGEFIAK